MKWRPAFWIAVVYIALAGFAPAQSVMDPPFGRPDAVIDLATKEGAGAVKGNWRYSNVKIVEVNAKGPGPDLKPSGSPIKTYDYEPHAGQAGFDDSGWQSIDPRTLDARRAGGGNRTRERLELGAASLHSARARRKYRRGSFANGLFTQSLAVFFVNA